MSKEETLYFIMAGIESELNEYRLAGIWEHKEVDRLVSYYNEIRALWVDELDNKKIEMGK